jgi:hypothetical protein
MSEEEQGEDKKQSRWGVILNALRRTKEENEMMKRGPSLEELIAFPRRGKTLSSERLPMSETMLRRNELLYRMEPLIFAGVNKLTRRIAGVEMSFQGGSVEDNAKAEAFFRSTNLQRLLPLLVKDAIVYGYAAAEIVPDEKGGVHIVQIYPLEFNYLREGGKMALDATGNPAGYTWRRMGTRVDLKPSECMVLRFYALGDYCLGISPVEVAFKAAWLKLNIQEAIGEAVFRHGFPLMYFNIGAPDPANPYYEVTPEKIKQAKDIIGSLDTATELILPWWIKADSVTGRGELSNVVNYIDSLSWAILNSFEMPKAMAAPGAMYGRDIEEGDFEKTVIAFQEDLRHQIEDQFLDDYLYKKLKTRPELHFKTYSPELQNLSLRRLNAYARSGLITYSRDVENQIRKQEGFSQLSELSDEEKKHTCIFDLGKCPVQKDGLVGLKDLQPYCNMCLKRLKRQKEIENEGRETKPEEPVTDRVEERLLRKGQGKSKE